MRLAAAPVGLAAVALVALTACRNSCQDICRDLARYAENDCGLTVPDGQMETCVDEHSRKALEEGERDACQTANETEFTDEWTCDEASAFLGLNGGQSGGTDTGS